MRKFWREESGQDLVEYALVVGILALGTVGTMQLAGAEILNMWKALEASLKAAAGKIIPVT